MDKLPTLPCPICEKETVQLGARGNRVICWDCADQATDSTGRPIEIGEHFEHKDGVLMLMGARATYREPDPEAGEMCAEVNRTWVAYIRGTEVRVYEGVAGWLGFVLPKAP